MKKRITIALAGNPNCGKTTLFNSLTGSRQRVGNWPGVTVECLEGSCKHGDYEYTIIDLPGIYSFSTYSLDEKVSREFILKEKPDMVINIIDASNLERNLYLTTQLIEMKAPVIVALNMMDIAKQRGISIEVDHLATHLDCPVVPIIANRKKGIEELLEKMESAIIAEKVSSAHVAYDSVLEDSLKVISEKTECYAEENNVDNRWLAVKLIEQDELAEKITEGTISETVKKESKKIEKHTGDSADIIVADGRYGFIHGLAKDVVRRNDELNKSVTDNIDKVVLNRFLGIPVFVAVMFLMFVITMKIGGPFINFFDELCGTLFVDGTRHLLSGFCPELLTTLLADGVGGGIQTVATFLPPITLIFLCLSILEDSGYMARAAFVMDRLLRAIGLPGKAFIPMLIGLGCNVPGIMATRTLENNRDRLLSIMINPFISCGARLPIYALFATAFFRKEAAIMLFGIYFTGIVLAVLTGLLFGKTILKGETSTFVMELPPYHIPTIRGVMFHTWSRLKGFIIRAGKVIIIVIICLSFLNSIGTDGSFGNENSDKSVLSTISRKITPILYPMGITDKNWPATVGLFTGIFAKEAVVGTINALYSQMGESSKNNKNSPLPSPEQEKKKFDFWGGIAGAFRAIPEGFKGFFGELADPVGVGGVIETAQAGLEDAAEKLEVEKSTFIAMRKFFPDRFAVIAYLLFILIYAPCLAVIAAIYRETNFKWALFSVSYLTGLAWIVATLFYQCSRLSTAPAAALQWIILCVSIIVLFILVLKKIGTKKSINSEK